MPEGLSTQRRTDTDAFCLSSSDSPSSPAKRLPSSRQRRSNTLTGSTRANPNRSSAKPTQALPTGIVQPFGRVDDRVDMASRHRRHRRGRVSKPGICSHTSERSDTAFVSRVERRP